MKALLVKALCSFCLSPAAAIWAWKQERRILKNGEALNTEQLNWAKALGIQHPEKIRIIREHSLAFPSPKWINKILQKMGFQLIQAAGMSLRYGVFISSQVKLSPRLLCHELTHTAQYEELGGIYAFMNRYLFECIYLGYEDSPMEKDADNRAEKVLQEKTL